jgi:hypothetical protein
MIAKNNKPPTDRKRVSNNVNGIKNGERKSEPEKKARGATA